MHVDSHVQSTRQATCEMEHAWSTRSCHRRYTYLLWTHASVRSSRPGKHPYRMYARSRLLLTRTSSTQNPSSELRLWLTRPAPDRLPPPPPLLPIPPSAVSTARSSRALKTRSRTGNSLASVSLSYVSLDAMRICSSSSYIFVLCLCLLILFLR